MIHTEGVCPQCVQCVRSASAVRPDAANDTCVQVVCPMRPSPPWKGAGDTPPGRTGGDRGDDLEKIN